MSTAALPAHQPCSCDACLAERGQRACPDCGVVVPATWARCWPCEQERQAGFMAIQRWWTC